MKVRNSGQIRNTIKDESKKISYSRAGRARRSLNEAPNPTMELSVCSEATAVLPENLYPPVLNSVLFGLFFSNRTPKYLALCVGMPSECDKVIGMIRQCV
jgi:hypothetical protein